MSEFKQYRRKQIPELRPVKDEEISYCAIYNKIPVTEEVKISISDEDRKNGSPKIGDMIARNPKNHKDQWLVAEQYFKDNFEPIE